MGIGFTIDTPLKVSQYGMDSAISLVDDILLEKLRKMFCGKFDIPYDEISEKVNDFRAKRITSYLDLIQSLAQKKFEELKDATIEKGNEIREYFNMLPESSEIKQEFINLTADYFYLEKIKAWINENLSMGSIDVNIMTKVDKANYNHSEKLPVEYNDAHAALRGFARSKLNSSIILSAGMNPRLYSYFEEFDDFYPDQKGDIRKKIVIKVSDFRSALIQGKFFAKKGLWVSEYRIESGLNCGGHAFATVGHLMGPILAEFRDKREMLTRSVHEILVQALERKNRPIPEKLLPLRITAQGGVGTAEEHQFLMEHYQLDSVGWGTPFLLVPEATNVDGQTMKKLQKAKEKDLYLSNISPLGVPFNSLRGNTKDLTKLSLIAKNKPGSTCPRRYLISNHDFTDKDVCTASRQYQRRKLREMGIKETSLVNGSRKEYEQVVDKSCLCVGLGTPALLVNKLDTKVEGEGVSVCPGPNMAYFSRVMSLKDITDHIYGRKSVIDKTERPNMFIKELNIYTDYLKDRIEEMKTSASEKSEKYLATFAQNLDEGIDYYSNMFSNLKDRFEDTKARIQEDLESCKQVLRKLQNEIGEIKVKY